MMKRNDLAAFTRRQRTLRHSRLLIEPVERRLLLSLTQTHTATGDAFSWDLATQGRSIIDSPIQLRSLLDSPVLVANNTAFLSLNGIAGDVTLKGHEQETSILQFEFAADRDHVGTDTGGPNFTELHIVTRASRQSTQLISRLQSNTIIPTGVLRYYAVNQIGVQTLALQTSLTNIDVRSYRSSTATDGRLTEEYTLGFSAANVQYTASGNNYNFSWDVPSQGGSVVDAPLPERPLIEEPSFGINDEAYLRLDGIQGTSTVKGQENQIPITAFSWSIDEGSRGPAFGTMHFVSRIAKQTPLLIDAAAGGNVILDADFLLRRPNGTSGGYSWTMNVDLDNAVVRSHQISSVPNAGVYEEFTLSFSAYNFQSAGTWGTLSCAYDLAASPASISNPRPIEREILHEKRGASSPSLFLELDGIFGEVTQKGYEKQIQVYDFEWGVDKPGLHPNLNLLHVVVPTGIASPLIMQRHHDQATIADATLLITGVSGGGVMQNQQQITLTNVKVQTYRINSLHGGQNSEEIALSFENVQFVDLLSNISSTINLPAGQATINDPAYAPRSVLDSDLPDGTYVPAAAYLDLNGIDGEVTEKGLENTIAILNFEWGEFTKEGIRYDELHLVAPSGKASPALLSAIANGTIIDLGSLRTYRTGLSGGRFLAYALTLRKSQITSYQANLTSAYGGVLTDEFTLRFDNFSLTATPLTGSPTSFASAQELPFISTRPAKDESITERGDSGGFAYLQLTGIVGGATVKGQEGKIEIESFEWSMDKTASGVHFTEMHFVSPNGRSTPQLMARLASGAAITTGNLIVGRPTGSGATIYYYNLAITQATLGSFRTSTHTDGSTVDEFSLRFATTTLGINPVSTTFSYDAASSATFYESTPPDRPMLRPGPTTPMYPAFLSLDGINGGSTMKGFEGMFELFGFEWRADRAFTSNPGGPDFGELRFVAPTSRGTPLLLQRLANPSLIANGTLRLYALGGSGVSVLYQTISLSNLLVSSHSITFDGVEPLDEFTLAFDRPADLVAPQLVSKVFEFETGHVMRFSFTENVLGSLSAADFTITNLTTAQTIPTAGYTITEVAPLSYALTPPAGVYLPDGNYQVTINPAGVEDASGNQLLASSVTPLLFHVLAGDANRDKSVNFSDLLVIGQNYGLTPATFSQGDFDYSGTVDFSDLLMLAQRYGTSLFSAEPAIAATALATKKRATGRAVEVIL